MENISFKNVGMDQRKNAVICRDAGIACDFYASQTQNSEI
ncbi:hypothetical protein SAMN04515620_12045 [Collimonas sp. OK607]|nr:hypothetical protein SAMN04515620_12045 [Collimonas sp. OK607]